MAQAKTLTNKELRRVLDYVASRPHSARNRMIVGSVRPRGVNLLTANV